MSESHARSIVKSLSYRFVGTVITFLVAWAISRDLSTATLIGLADSAAKVGAFYVHERVWNQIGFGRATTTE